MRTGSGSAGVTTMSAAGGVLSLVAEDTESDACSGADSFYAVVVFSVVAAGWLSPSVVISWDGCRDDCGVVAQAAKPSMTSMSKVDFRNVKSNEDGKTNVELCWFTVYLPGMHTVGLL
jgi:hypothetical protein